MPCCHCCPNVKLPAVAAGHSCHPACISVPCFVSLASFLCRKKKKPKQDAYLAGVSDRKLKGQLKHTERLYKQSNKAAAHINQWLAPAEAGFVEAEGEARLSASSGSNSSSWLSAVHAAQSPQLNRPAVAAVPSCGLTLRLSCLL